MTHQFDQRAYYFKIDVTIKKIRNALQKKFIESELDLTVDQWVLVDNIFRNPAISQIYLAEVTHKDPPTVTRIVDLLEKKGFVERKMSTLDRRKFNLYLTSKGTELYTAAAAVVYDLRQLGWNKLSDEDYEQFIRVMDTIYNNFADMDSNQ
jgi:DNA-binding MarR family transcriptional regulator